MLHSAEVRWFFPGSMAIDTIHWFCIGRVIVPDERTDRYLVFPGCESVGVKIRQGRYEIKALKGAAEIVQFHGGISGRGEAWVKWSYAEPPVAAWIEALLSESQDWIDVAKTRWLRLYSQDGGLLAEASPRRRVQEGCLVELTRILARNQEWWSLALEAFGEPVHVRETLRRAGVFFFANHPPLEPLTIANSCSYPAWLAGIRPPD